MIRTSRIFSKVDCCRTVVLALLPLLLLSCRSSSTNTPESAVATDKPEPTSTASPAADSPQFPTVDSTPDAPFVQYDTSPAVYRRFSGRPDDEAKIGGKPIIGFIAKNLSAEGKAIERLSGRPHLIEKHLLNGTEFEPKPMPKRIILDQLLAFQKRHWRYGPGIKWNPDEIPVERRVENAEMIYGRVATFPEKHPKFNQYEIYPLTTCLRRFRPAPWGPLQINYFCMIPAVYRSCIRSYLPSGEAFTPDRIKSIPRLYDKETNRPDRELVLATCLAVKGRRDDPLWNRLASELRFPRDIGISTGGELFDLVGNNDVLTALFSTNVSWASRQGVFKWVGRDATAQEAETMVQEMADSLRRFYLDQYFTVGGKEVNLYNYIMHAPVFQFKVEDQYAILNSLYGTMGQTAPNGSAFWPRDGSTACPLGNYQLPDPELADIDTVLRKCDPRHFTVDGPAGSSGR